MAYTEVTRDEVKVGDDLTVWYREGNQGQGGIVLEMGDLGIWIQSPIQSHFFAWADVHHLTVDQPLPAEECLEFHTGKCEGPVEYCGTPPHGTRALPRCEFHNNKRWEDYENSDTQKFAASSVGVVPSWYDPEYGEALEED